MKIKIDEVRSVSGNISVAFSTDFGSAVATWSADIPKVGEQHDVEFEIDEEFAWGNNVDVSGGRFSLSIKDRVIFLSASLVSMAEDGVAIIDINGTKTMIELEGCLMRPPFFISLSFEKLTLCPANL
ncbi:hypothetical protein QMK47_25890 [Pseudomonas sp. P9_35]|uniref:hypothetical protein n=1 Tax=Pseudomonas TaxID=286 RepID=UPI0012E369B5|nr:MULTISPECIES: hypothetical protein [Pseudomonas]UVM60792.1 hypothetical protein LOY50_25260 [Pseudomonas sp. B21-010]WHS53033.1 hypothetical protein QLH64_22270 [Pseudomonas brassicacearum]WPN62903.1 hypothetical protein QMK48_24985 [Pseudomonas sp. P9_32]WPN68657.1 hypothetical protein QMK47_25890 [Pseudomonas sp. P9_35]